MDAPDGTAALNTKPVFVITSASMVGWPLESNISLALIDYIVDEKDLMFDLIKEPLVSWHKPCIFKKKEFICLIMKVKIYQWYLKNLFTTNSFSLK